MLRHFLHFVLQHPHSSYALNEFWMAPGFCTNMDWGVLAFPGHGEHTLIVEKVHYSANTECRTGPHR